jgi:spermidine dehydrogenase
MSARDRQLGMDRDISRRDFLSGVSIAIGASLLSGCENRSEESPAALYYPPAATGMRGAHPGSFEVAHAAVQGQQWAGESTGEHYDLVVVGAGISGLSAAYMYRRDVDQHARILVIDNHDDFGGHAKRNEFTIDGRTLIGLGGTMLMVAPANYPAVATQLIRELGIEIGRRYEFHHDDLYELLGMGRASFFDKETFGEDYLAIGSYGNGDGMRNAPMSTAAIAELDRLFADEKVYLAGMTPAERYAVIHSHSWRDYLAKYAGIGEEALTYIQKYSDGTWAIGADALPAWIAMDSGYPGFAGMDVGDGDDDHDEDSDKDGDEDSHATDAPNFYFPDGNASIARLLVRNLVPGSAPGDSMEDIVTARFNYSSLDQPENDTRIRLSSTVVDLRHRDGKLDGMVDVTYVHNSEARVVTASKVIWSGYHAMLPAVCPDVPEEQVAAYRSSVRAPLVYTNVLIRNWRSFANLGFWRAYCPGSFFQSVRVNRAASFGDYHFPQSPDEPTIVHLQHIPLAPGLPAAEQFRAGSRALLETSFASFERNIRDQLGRMLGPGGFDPARDIAGITVNRWPHGYAYSVDAESGDVAWLPERWPHENRPWVDARQRIGNIAIAGTDSSSNAMTESAIEEAQRSIQSLTAEDS